MAGEYVCKISSRYLQKWLSYDNRHFHVISRLHRDFPIFFNRSWRFNKRFRVIFFVFFAKIWPKTCITTLTPDFVCDLFYLVTWDVFDLSVTWDVFDKAHKMVLTDVRGIDTINANSLALFELKNVEILLADVTKPEKSNILTLTWPVTSLVTVGN